MSISFKDQCFWEDLFAQAIGMKHVRKENRAIGSSSSMKCRCCDDVAKMVSHAIFQYNVLAIDDTHNTWTNMIVKMNIRRLLGSSDDKEKISVARPEGPPLRDKN